MKEGSDQGISASKRELTLARAPSSMASRRDFLMNDPGGIQVHWDKRRKGGEDDPAGGKGTRQSEGDFFPREIRKVAS